MKWFAAAFLLFALSGVALARGPLATSARSVEGEIQAADQTGITVLAGGKTVKIDPEHLDVHYYYSEWSGRAAKDAKTHG